MGTRFVARSFYLPLKVDEWMVSRPYFLAAAQAWFTSLDPSTVEYEYTVGSTHLRYRHSAGLYLAYSTRIVLEMGHHNAAAMKHEFTQIEAYPRLRHLKILLNHCAFADLERCVWLDKLEQQDLERVFSAGSF